MALNSPSHRFGQMIGDVLEDTMIKYLQPVAEKYSLYLDYRHARSARNGRKEVRWVDVNGNTHKLDIVMEKNGDEARLGEPRVFIEIAWRRYTKHSKNKAQEISGAIQPLIAKYSSFTPFFGAIVAGVFTQNSLNQMTSEGFEVVYIPIEIIEKAFNVVGIDAHWEENTQEHILQEKIDAYGRLSCFEVEKLKDELIKLTSEQLGAFRLKLCNSLERKIESIRIMSMFGDESAFSNVNEACTFIATFNEKDGRFKFYKFEIYVRYSNGDKLEAQYTEKSNAIAFLQSIGR
ncbi:MAG: hypothetical protein FWG72_05560 [Oscillospiraceae bacterium]|nr:hypothetical protein [Oscillospiraceae bacterium]